MGCSSAATKRESRPCEVRRRFLPFHAPSNPFAVATGIWAVDESAPVLLTARTIPRARRGAQIHIAGRRGC